MRKYSLVYVFRLLFYSLYDFSRHRNREPEGCVILRSLLSAGSRGLGFDFSRTTLRCNTKQYRLLNVLGRGSFATVFEATDVSTAQLVAIKRPSKTYSIAKIKPTPEKLTQFQLECAIMRSFSNSNCRNLPRLVISTWSCDMESLFIPFLPIGQPLAWLASTTTKPDRKKLATRLRDDLSEGLREAHKRGYCHCDIRPANIIYDPSHACFVIIDWGLGRAPNSFMHPHTGGIAFFADELIDAEIRGCLDKTDYLTKYDYASANFIPCAFILGNPYLAVPWANFALENIVTHRNACMLQSANAS